jgi:hypothetical protein
MTGARAGAGRIQMLGLCRFSLLVDGGFQTVHDTLEARRAELYAPDRLASRFAWFETVCLPGIRAQTDGDFTLIVLTGEDFPPQAMARLRDLVAPIPQLRIVTRPPGNHRDLCREVMSAHIDASTEVVGQFRIDDDDAFASDYIARSRSDFPMLRGLYDRHGVLASNYARGLVLVAGEDGLRCEMRAGTNWACALTLYFPPDHPKGVMDYGHHRLAEWMPTVSQNDTVMYVRGIHATNDTVTRGLGTGRVLTEERTVTLLRNRFGIGLGAVEQALAKAACE